MDINILLTDTSDTAYYDENFILLLYMHRTFLLNNYSKVIPIDQHLAYKYDGDLSGLLDELNFPKRYHIPILIINNFSSNDDYNLNILQLIIPSLEKIDSLKTYYSTKK